MRLVPPAVRSTGIDPSYRFDRRRRTAAGVRPAGVLRGRESCAIRRSMASTCTRRRSVSARAMLPGARCWSYFHQSSPICSALSMEHTIRRMRIVAAPPRPAIRMSPAMSRPLSRTSRTSTSPWTGQDLGGHVQLAGPVPACAPGPAAHARASSASRESAQPLGVVGAAVHPGSLLRHRWFSRPSMPDENAVDQVEASRRAPAREVKGSDVILVARRLESGRVAAPGLPAAGAGLPAVRPGQLAMVAREDPPQGRDVVKVHEPHLHEVPADAPAVHATEPAERMAHRVVSPPPQTSQPEPNLPSG